MLPAQVAVPESHEDHFMQQNAAIEQVLARPLFIVGAERSGTTWLQRMLISHPLVCGGHESMFFMTFGRFIKNEVNTRGGGIGAYWSEEEMVEVVSGLWRRTFEPIVKSKPAARLLVEKTPGHATCMFEIAKLLPSAKFVHIIRDSRAAVASMVAASKADWGRSWAANNVRDAALRWAWHVRSANEFTDAHGSNCCLMVHYEQLRASPNLELRRILEFGGIDGTNEDVESCIAANELVSGTPRSHVRLPTPQNTYQGEPEGFYRLGSVDGWKQELNLLQRAIVWRFTRKSMRRNGYRIGLFR